jgi:hypothetical protein
MVTLLSVEADRPCGRLAFDAVLLIAMVVAAYHMLQLEQRRAHRDVRVDEAVRPFKCEQGRRE